MVVIVLMMIAYIVVLKWPKANLNSKAVEVEVSAQKVYDDYTTDEATAQTAYYGKVILVTGVIDEKYQDEDGSPIVILKGDSGDPTAVVSLESSEAKELEAYSEGSPIKIKAQCSGMLMEVTFNKGVIVK